MTRLVLLLFAPMMPCLAASAQQANSGRLLALSKHDHTLAIVDGSTLKVITKVPVGEDPHEVIASTDGHTAYVSNYGFGAFHTLARIDLAAGKALPPVDLGPLTGPHGLTFVDGKVWFTAEGAKAIGRFDPLSQKVDWILGTGQNRTHMIYVSPDAQQIVTTNVASGTVDLIAREPVPMGPPPPTAPGLPATPPTGGSQQGPPPTPRMDWNANVVKVGNGSEGFDLSPNGKEIWVGNAQDGTISVIDRASRSVTQTIQAEVRGANRLRFTPDGQHVLVSTLGGSGLVILNASTHSVLKRLPIGRGAAGILIEPGGKRAFVACSPDNTIAIIDLSTLTVTGRLDVGPEPDGLAWAVAP